MVDHGQHSRIAGKFDGEKFSEFTIFERLAKKVWQINRSANRLLIVSTNLDGFSLTNHNLPNLPNFPTIQYI